MNTRKKRETGKERKINTQCMLLYVFKDEHGTLHSYAEHEKLQSIYKCLTKHTKWDVLGAGLT